MPADVAVIILTFNEEDNIVAALDSVVNWATEVFVVDSFSTDRTVDLALDYSANNVSVVQNTFIDYSHQWNWCLDNLPINSTWTLKLDADERVNKEFTQEIDQLLHHQGAEAQGLYFRRKMYFMGKPISHGGFDSTYVLHFWKTGAARFENRSVNEHVVLEGKTAKLSAFVDHYDFKTLSEWIDKHNRYASMEAQCLIDGNLTGDVDAKLFGNPDQHRMALRKIYRKLPFKHLAYFLYRYLWLRAFLDGKPGFRYCILHAFYRYWIDLKVDEYYSTGKSPSVNWPARGNPNPRLRNMLHRSKSS